MQVAQQSQSCRLTARWVFPVDSPPLENGAVEIVDGRIAAVHAGPDARAVSLGNVALIPGLVNAHTHLELSDVTAPLGPASPFTAWLKSVVAHRRERAAGPTTDAQTVAQGLAECLRQGTTLLADIVSTQWVSPAAEQLRPRYVAFLELLGLAPERVAQQVESGRRHVAQSQDGIGHGLSPHAPYSVHPELLSSLVQQAIEHRAPVAIHVAETLAERELLLTGQGEFVDFLKGLGVWRPEVFPGGHRPLEILKELARAPRGLVVHGNYLEADEIEFLAGVPQLSVVYCPRTHHYFGHAPHPWPALRSRGVNVALGTDSRASNPDLSVWNELLFLRAQFPEVPPSTWLEMGTLAGARALGHERELGTISAGKWADLAVVALPAVSSNEPFGLLMHPQSQIQATLLAGSWVGADSAP